MRAGLALRQKWADERQWAETERRMPGYHARHWAAGVRRVEVFKRYGRLLAEQMPAEKAIEVLAALQCTGRLRVDERPGGVFVVTARREARS